VVSCVDFSFCRAFSNKEFRIGCTDLLGKGYILREGLFPSIPALIIMGTTWYLFRLRRINVAVCKHFLLFGGLCEQAA
jgi:hypothetical protein